MRTTTFTFLDYLPNSLREAPKRRAAEFVGLGVLAALAAACAALVTWSVADPSLNHATSTPIHNLLGRPGAVVADVAMQFFGLACVVALIPPAHWGWRLTTEKRLDRIRNKLILWVARLDAGGRLRVDAADSGELAAADRARRRHRRRGAVGRRAGCSPAGRSARPPSAWRSPPRAILSLTAAAGYHLKPAAERRSRAGGRRRRAAARARALRERRRRQRRRAGFRPRLARRAHPHRADDQERAAGGCCSARPPRPPSARRRARPGSAASPTPSSPTFPPTRRAASASSRR